MNAEREKRDPVGAAAAAFAQSSSILLSELQLTVPALARMCRQLDNAFLTHGVLLAKPVFANAYLTPPSSQGFGIHYDDHCVLVLQLSGTKNWRVAATDHSLPVERCKQLLPEDSLQNRLLELELRAGDLLYIPRGFPHMARCTEQMSLHVTFGIKAVTWSSMLHRIADDLAFFRSSVRPHLSTELSIAEYLGQQALSALKEANPIDHIEAMLGECLDMLPPLTPDTDDGFLTPALSDATLLVRCCDVLTMPALHRDIAVLHFPGGPLELPAAAFEALAYVADNDRFRIAEIPGCNAFLSRIELARLIIRKRIVSVAKDQVQNRSEHLEVADHAN